MTSPSCPTCTSSTSSTSRRRVRLMVLGGVVATLLPVTTPVLDARGAEGTAFGGFTAAATATPIRIEVFEPSVPIPVDAGKAQLEFSLGYSTVRADSGQSTSRSSYFWPGDPVGEGLKTFAEQLGFPPSPLTDGGYPVQVNAQFPGDVTTQSDTRVPGGISKAVAGEGTAKAETGFSPDGVVLGPSASDAKPQADPLTGLLSGLQSLLGAPQGGAPANPLSLLVDVDGYVAVSSMDASKGPVVAESRSTLGEVRLLGGLVTLGGVETVARATSDGTKAETGGTTAFGSMSIAGQRFAVGPDGISAQGATTAIPGLSDLPATALQQLGLSIETPKGVRTVDGDEGTSASDGLRITIDTKTLSPLLQALPTGVLADLIPAEAGPLRGVVAGLSGLAPKIVITIGLARASVDTVPPIEAVAPDAGSDAGASSEVPAEVAAAAPPAAGTVGIPAGVAGASPVGAAPAADAGQVEDLVGAAPASAGLPELFSIPGMLLLGAFAAAAFAGTWFRRLGVAALGGGAPCSHGLASGLPDLRKA